MLTRRVEDRAKTGRQHRVCTLHVGAVRPSVRTHDGARRKAFKFMCIRVGSNGRKQTAWPRVASPEVCGVGGGDLGSNRPQE